MKVSTCLLFLFSVLISSCTKDITSYPDPPKEPRFSINFLVPLSVGSPYNVGDPLLVNVIISANKVTVDTVAFIFSDANAVLATVSTSFITSSPILRDPLWTVQYTTGISYVIPVSWAGKTITLTALANGESAASTFKVN